MASEDAIKIAVELLLSIAVITLTVIGVRTTTHGISAGAQNAVVLARDADTTAVKSINNRTVDGTTAITFLDKYSDTVPILLITGELYQNDPGKCSYNASEMHNTLAPEYINPNASYRIEVVQTKDEMDIQSIRVIQSNLLGIEDLPKLDLNDPAYIEACKSIELHEELIQAQYQLYKKNK